jgi:hypothetical protein
MVGAQLVSTRLDGSPRSQPIPPSRRRLAVIWLERARFGRLGLLVIGARCPARHLDRGEEARAGRVLILA